MTDTMARMMRSITVSLSELKKFQTDFKGPPPAFGAGAWVPASFCSANFALPLFNLDKPLLSFHVKRK
jgi:hypothetical protein